MLLPCRCTILLWIGDLDRSNGGTVEGSCVVTYLTMMQAV